MSDELKGTITAGVSMSGGLLVAKGDKGDAYIITESDKQEIKEALSADISELKSDIVDIIKSTDMSRITSESIKYYNDSQISVSVSNAEVNVQKVASSNPFLFIGFSGLEIGKTYKFSFAQIGDSLSVHALYRKMDSAGTGGSQFIKDMTTTNGVSYAEFEAPSTTLVVRLSMKNSSSQWKFYNFNLHSGKGNIIDNDAILYNGQTYDEIVAYLLSRQNEERPVKISFLNAEAITGYSRQSILIQFPNGKNMLMDAGWENDASDIRQQMLIRGVTKLDYLMVTHYHNDHAGGFVKWLSDDTFSSKTIDITDAVVYLPPIITSDNIAQCVGVEGESGIQQLLDYQTAIVNGFTSLGNTIVRPTESQVISVGEAKIMFWNCDHSVYASDTGSTYKSGNYNDFSICADVIYGTQRFSNTADIGPIAQNYMSKKCYKANIMSAPHHGWDNGVNNLIPDFINNINPDVVISINGSSHYPSSENTREANMLKASSPIYSWCQYNGISAYATCMNGAIDMKMYKQSWMFDGKFTRFIRNNKDWKYNDNSEFVES